MYCRNCGKQLPDNSRFCQECGASQSENQIPEKRGIFAKKIFIGSIVSFVVGTIGVTAIFFPSVFNLEKSNITEFTKEIKTPSDAKDLYNFLIKNDKKIIKLELAYTPERYLNADYTKNPGEKTPNLKYDFVGCPSGKKDEHNRCSIKYILDPYESGPKLNNKMFFMDPDDRQRFMDADTGNLLYDASNLDLFGYEIGSVIPYELFGFCNIVDIPCQLNIKEHAKFPLAGLLFEQQLEPGFYYKKWDRSVDPTPFLIPRIVNNEVVLYGDNYNFSSAHAKVKYKDNIEYVDHGSLSFILNESDDTVPVYLISIDAIEEGPSSECKPVVKPNPLKNKYETFDYFDLERVEIIYNPHRKNREIGNCEYILSSAITVNKNEEIEYTNNSSKNIETNLFKKLFGFSFYKKDNQSPLVTNIFDNSFQVQIKNSTQDNTLYKWNSTLLSDNFPRYNEQQPIYGSPKVQMRIFGYFLVNVNKNTNVDNFPPQYCEFQKFFSDYWIKGNVKYNCQADTIILDPLSLKDIEQSKYK